MKNKFLKIFSILILSFSFFETIFADEFIFNVSELQVSDNGNIYNGVNKGKITTASGVEITSDNFEYLKVTNRLQAFGNAQLYDVKEDITINAEQIFYLKDKEIIYTVGKTFIKISNTHDIEGDDIKFFKNEMILSSSKKAIIKDYENTVYKLDEFEYSITPEILRGKKIQVITNYRAPTSDEYFFENGIFNFKEKKFSAKDTNLRFHRTLFDDYNNDPRLKSVTSYGDEFNTYFEKGIFTSCKDTGKCPPWKIKSKTIRHDKIKRQINYTHAWVSIYDMPVAYFPKFFHPDPSVKRKSGFLKPSFMGSKGLGNSTYTPYFLVISDSQDLTIKPRYFRNNKFILQNEYRQKTENSFTMADFSIAQGHNSSSLDLGDSRSHFFVNSLIDLKYEDYLNSELKIKFEKASNDTYLDTFAMVSPLFGNQTLLESRTELLLDHENFAFSGSFRMYETLKGLNNDRYQYVLPTYSFSKPFTPENINGSFNFNHGATNTLSNTNIVSTGITNNLNFTSFEDYTDQGIKTNFEVFLKNLNSLGNSKGSYKSSFETQGLTSYRFNTSLPLFKSTEKYFTKLVPKMRFRFSPHSMENIKNNSKHITVNNVYNSNHTSFRRS